MVTTLTRAVPIADNVVVYSPPTVMRRLARRWWVVIILGAVGALIGGAIAATSAKRYTATADIQVNSDAAAVVAGSNVLPNSDPIRAVSTEVTILGSDTVHVEAQRVLGYEPPAVSVGSGADEVVSISVKDESAPRAAAEANAYVTAYFTVVGQQTRQQLTPQLAQLQEGIASITHSVAANTLRISAAATLPPSAGRSALTLAAAQASATATVNVLIQGQTALVNERAGLQAELNRIQGLLAIGSLHSRRLSDASVPDTTSNPSTARQLALGLVVGLILGGLLAVALGPTPLERRRHGAGLTGGEQEDEGV